MWRVVGGTEKGGILVRTGSDLKSVACELKLSTGSVVEQVELLQERLNYRLKDGAGPTEGWVSLKVSGKPLLIRAEGADLQKPLVTARKVSEFNGVDIVSLRERAAHDDPNYICPSGAEEPPEWDGLKPPPPRGRFVASGTGRPQAGKDWRPQLACLPTKLRAVTPFEEKMKGKLTTLYMQQMTTLVETGEGPLGYWYGLRIPYTLEMIQRYGAEFLTKAFHAAATLPRNNSVTKLTVTPFVGGSMSLKCFLTVEYANPDPNLHTELFVKYPFAAGTPHEQKERWVSRFVMNNDGPEIDFARILSSGAPIKCPKYYFGDLCIETGTALLITEKLPLPGPSDDFGPFELEAIPYKSVDYLLDEPEQYYDAMTRNIACLAGWGKSGRLGRDIEKVFPPPATPPLWMSTASRVETFLEFIYRVGTCLVPEEIVGPHGEVNPDAWFVRTLRQVLPEVEKAQAAISEYLLADPNYGGFTHQNMNTDNAMFWRDEAGRVCSGFIDWGRFKRDNFARALSSGYMCCDLCEVVQLSDEAWIRSFIDALAESGGPRLDFNVFWEHYMLAWLLQGLAAVDLPRQLFLTGSSYMTPDGWLKIPSYKDPRIFRLPNYNNGMVAILRNFVYYWKCRDLASFWDRWKKKHLENNKLRPKRG